MQRSQLSNTPGQFSPCDSAQVSLHRCAQIPVRPGGSRGKRNTLSAKKKTGDGFARVQVQSDQGTAKQNLRTGAPLGDLRLTGFETAQLLDKPLAVLIHEPSRVALTSAARDGDARPPFTVHEQAIALCQRIAAVVNRNPLPIQFDTVVLYGSNA